MFFHCLGFGFYCIEKALLFIRTTVRYIPVAVVVDESPLLTGDAPVSQFVQGATFLVAGKLHLGQ